MNQTLLIELLTEELPPKALAKLGEAFATGIVNGLKSRDFLDSDSVATSYASPRRLAVSISGVRATSPDKLLREKILPVSVALDAAGNASAPLAKKLAAMGFPDLSNRLTCPTGHNSRRNWPVQTSIGTGRRSTTGRIC